MALVLIWKVNFHFYILIFWIFKEWALRLILSISRDVSLSIYLSVCPLFMSTFSRPLIGPQVT